MTREEPKGRMQEKNNPQQIKGKKDMRMANGQSTENLNKAGESQMSVRGNGQMSQGQSRSENVPVKKTGTTRVSGVPVPKENSTRQGRDEKGSEQHRSKVEHSPVTQMEQYSEAHVS